MWAHVRIDACRFLVEGINSHSRQCSGWSRNFEAGWGNWVTWAIPHGHHTTVRGGGDVALCPEVHPPPPLLDQSLKWSAFKVLVEPALKPLFHFMYNNPAQVLYNSQYSPSTSSHFVLNGCPSFSPVILRIWLTTSLEGNGCLREKLYSLLHTVHNGS